MTQSGGGRHRAPRRRRRTALVIAAVILVPLVGWAAVTLTSEFADANGAPAMVVVATWLRDNRMGIVAAQAENLYYRYVDRPQVGGVPTVSADLTSENDAGTTGSDDIRSASTSVPTGGSKNPSAGVPAPAPIPAPSTPAHLDPPPTIVSPVSPALPKEGEWQPVASHVDGVPAIYVTRVRADAVHTGYYASVMWIDPTLTKAMFVPGYQEPGGPNPDNGALPQKYWPDVLANINGAFRLDDSRGGYYYEGTTVRPLVAGRASAVITKDGTLHIGKWGRDLKMTPDVAVVRQNLDLIVDHGTSQVSNGNDNVQWGATTDKESLAWRSALGVRKDGSLVYVGSPYLSAAALADVMVRAGVQRAMVLDMNNWWTAGFYFRHDKSGKPLCRKLDPAIQEGCDRFLQPYKRDSFQFLANPAGGQPSSTPAS